MSSTAVFGSAHDSDRTTLQIQSTVRRFQAWVDHSRQDPRRFDDARSWNESRSSATMWMRFGAHGRQRRQRAPDRLLAGRRRGVPIRLVRLDDDLGRAREQRPRSTPEGSRVSRRRTHPDRRPFRARSCRNPTPALTYMLRSVPASRPKTQRRRAAAAVPRRTGAPLGGRRRCRERAETPSGARPTRSPSDAMVVPTSASPRVPIDEDRNAHALQPSDQVRLADVDDHEIGLERQDALEVRVRGARRHVPSSRPLAGRCRSSTRRRPVRPRPSQTAFR